MQFIDSLTTPPHVPTAAPVAPYRMEARACGVRDDVPTKIYANGSGGKVATEDEVAVWGRVVWLEAAVAAGERRGEPPALPYDVRPYTVGYGPSAREWPFKVFTGGRVGSGYLSEDEASMWKYLTHLEAEVAKLPAVAVATAVQAVAAEQVGQVDAGQGDAATHDVKDEAKDRGWW